ncbi:uncharacterized protein TNCV_1476761 [Trichonephila clavipes]|nr:uncharacterized protein TNCV_1476761 [Trichonephila clavipes]
MATGSYMTPIYSRSQRYLSTTEKVPHHRIRAHYEQLPEFERDRIIELKEEDWTDKRIARHMGRSDAVIERCWQKWVDNDRFPRHDGSGRSRVTELLSDLLSQRLIHRCQTSDM